MAVAPVQGLPARLTSLLAPVVADAGFDLEDLELATVGRRRLLRVVVDADGGVDLDAVAELSGLLSAALDDSALMEATPYVLEVTSPGADRPLTAPRHWRRAVGRLVRVDLLDGRTHTARLVCAGADGVGLDGVAELLPYAEVRRARVELEFSRAGEG